MILCLVMGCEGEPEDLQSRLYDAGTGSSSGGSSGSDSSGSSSGSSGGSDGGTASSSGSDSGGATPWSEIDDEDSYANGEESVAARTTGRAVYPEVPGCVEVYQGDCDDGLPRSQRGDWCFSTWGLWDVYAEPVCSPYGNIRQEPIDCADFCDGGTCQPVQVTCPSGHTTTSAQCNCP